MNVFLMVLFLIIIDSILVYACQNGLFARFEKAGKKFILIFEGLEIAFF